MELGEIREITKFCKLDVTDFKYLPYHGNVRFEKIQMKALKCGIIMYPLLTLHRGASSASWKRKFIIFEVKVFPESIADIAYFMNSITGGSFCAYDINSSLQKLKSNQINYRSCLEMEIRMQAWTLEDDTFRERKRKHRENVKRSLNEKES